MAITVCPAALQLQGRCRDRQCHLRHDAVLCKACKCFILRGEVSKHRRMKEHRHNCGFSEWKTYARLLGTPVLPLPSPQFFPKPSAPVPKLNQRKTGKAPRQEKKPISNAVPTGVVEDKRVVVGHTGGILLEIVPTIGKDGTSRFSTATISIVIEKSVVQSSLSLTALRVTGSEAESFSVRSPGPLPIQVRQNKPRRVQVSFSPSRPGEFSAALELDVCDRTQRKNAITPVAFTFTRRLHGVAAAPQPQVTNSVRGNAGSRGGKKRTESKQSKKREGRGQPQVRAAKQQSQKSG